MGSSIKFDMDEKGKPVDQTKYRDLTPLRLVEIFAYKVCELSIHI